MAKVKIEKAEVENKQEKVLLDNKGLYNFESNGTSPYLQKGIIEVTGELAEIFISKGYGKICNK